MNRTLRTVLVSAAVLLSGTVAFGVAAAITPPGVEGVDVVVTDRPVLSVAAASTVLPVTPATVKPTTTGRADKPVTTAAPSTRKRTVVGVASDSGPKSVVVPKAKPKPPTVNVGTDTETDHEVVTPPVRDEDDDDDSDEESSGDSSAPSADLDPNRSEAITRRSGDKGD